MNDSRQAGTAGSSGVPGVLVVDDDRDLLEMLVILLRTRPDLRAEGSSSGEEALLKFPVFRPRVLVVDLAMPRMSGWELIRRLREDPSGSSARILLMTALPTDEIERTARSLGVARIVPKPFTPTEFLRWIETELEGPPGPRLV